MTGGKNLLGLSVALLILFPLSGRAAHSRQRVGSSRTSSSARYDRSITTFDPSGRLLQVEYSLAASQRGPSVLAATFNGTQVFFRANRRNVHRIDHHVWLLTAGLSGDARILASEARRMSRQHRLSYGEPIQVDEMADKIAELHHQCTTVEGIRPFGCSAILLGVNPVTHIMTLFRLDSGGVVEACWYCCIGKNEDRFMADLGKVLSAKQTLSKDAAIRGMLDIGGSQSRSGDKKEEFDFWMFDATGGSPGEVKVDCFLGANERDSISKIIGHVKAASS